MGASRALILGVGSLIIGVESLKISTSYHRGKEPYDITSNMLYYFIG